MNINPSSGNSVNGYPIQVTEGSGVFPLMKFMDVTDKYYNNNCGSGLTISEFSNYNYIWAHKFEAEVTSQGWIGINMKLSAAATKNLCLVAWIISPSAISLDKFNQIERINL